jgi:hypothetical protein
LNAFVVVADYLYRPQGSTGVKASRLDDYVSGVPFSALRYDGIWLDVVSRRADSLDIVAAQRFQPPVVVLQPALAARRIVRKNPKVVSPERHNMSMRLHRSLSRRRCAIPAAEACSPITCL